MNSDGSCFYKFMERPPHHATDMTWCQSCSRHGSLVWSTGSTMHMHEMRSPKRGSLS